MQSFSSAKNTVLRCFSCLGHTDAYRIYMTLLPRERRELPSVAKCLKPAHFRFLRNKMMGLTDGTA